MRFPKAARLALPAASLLVLAACAVPRDYVMALPPQSPSDSFVAANNPAFTTEQHGGQWWRL